MSLDARVCLAKTPRPLFGVDFVSVSFASIVFRVHQGYDHDNAWLAMIYNESKLIFRYIGDDFYRNTEVAEDLLCRSSSNRT